MDVVPQLDFSVYPSQIFWFVCSFLLLYVVVRCVVVPKVESIISSRLVEHNSALGVSLESCDFLQDKLVKQVVVLEAAQQRARELEQKVVSDLGNAVELAKELLKSGVDEMLTEVDERLESLKREKKEELISLSIDVASMYYAKVSGVGRVKKSRIRELVTGIYEKRL
ncbi:hypothetical protein AB9K21_00370 [Anaplasma phagocytophilum]|uniref:Plant ATP synthase F0 family protein n=1 Tax=Anaplasma phagocytophilum str. ApMUC09 TaxID=1359152 RepID=A0A0F3NBQ7_ANAPH|nr:plant ATP synthase F0 family protein [Anaplasma phagocytophilum str. ApMUC09]SCV64742.1 ATP synthase subunit b' [Anaplasma phagocytophilum]